MEKNFTTAQDITQTIRGTIIDQDSQIPVIGANIIILGTDPLMGASTDITGSFRIENVPVGRATTLPKHRLSNWA